MFRSSTILRELVQSLAKIIFLLKHSVNSHLHTIYNDVILLDVFNRNNFSQALYKLPEDGRIPKHVGAIFMCILM